MSVGARMRRGKVGIVCPHPRKRESKLRHLELRGRNRGGGGGGGFALLCFSETDSGFGGGGILPKLTMEVSHKRLIQSPMILMNIFFIQGKFRTRLLQKMYQNNDIEGYI